MRRVLVLFALTSFTLAIYACTDAPNSEATDEGSLSAGMEGRSVVAVTSSDHPRTCPGAVLPGGIVLAARACIAGPSCAPIYSTLRVFAGDGAGMQVEKLVTDTFPAPGSTLGCSEFVALRLQSAFSPAVAPPMKVRIAPVPVGTELDVVAFRLHEGPAMLDGGASDAEADANADAGADSGAEQASDAAGPDADSGDAGPLDAATDASSEAGALASDADAAAPAMHRIVRRVSVAQTHTTGGSLLTRRFEVSPSADGFALAVDGHGSLAGISDGASTYAEPATLRGFYQLVDLYASPSDVLDVADASAPAAEAGADPGAVAPHEDPPKKPGAGRPEPTPTSSPVPSGETAGCAISSRSSNGFHGGATAFAIFAIGGLLVSRRRRSSLR